MGWNGSGGGSTPVEPKVPAKKPSPIRGIVAGLLVVAVSAVAYFVFFSGSEEPQKVEKSTKQERIKEVAPAAAPKAVEPVPEKPKKELPWWRRDTTNGLTEAQLKKWKVLHRPPPAYTNMSMATRPLPKYAIFGTHVENEIACLMTLQPGQSLIGSPHYNKKLNAEFIKSCETPIIVEEGDDEYTANLKREMNQMKIELRQRMADGEDLVDILTDTRKEMQRLAQVKRDVEADVKAMIKEGAQSEEDIDTYIDAANKLLESKGIAPMKKMNPLVRRAFMRSLQSKPMK